MASQAYYHKSSYQHQDHNQPQMLRPEPQPYDYPHHSQTTQSLAPSYRTEDAFDGRSISQPHNSHPNSYSDHIPMKDNPRIQTTEQEWPAGQNSAYPPSPESQNANPDVLPVRSDRKKRKKGVFSGKVPWFVYFITLVQVTVFIVEIVKNSIITGSPIMIHPSFNPMIGPSTYVLINMGARFVPCMRTTYSPGTNTPYPESPWPCPNTTSSLSTDPNNQCTLGQLCGLGGFDYSHPDQWYRFITPMFLHAGVIHIGFNMLLQMTLGRDMEKAIGSIRFALVYLSSGIFGFVLGGNFAAPAIASTGASGCLFGILALVLLDLLYTWNERPSPAKDLLWILFDVIVSFVLGLLPGLDNFSHIGGFLMGLLLGICILHSPSRLRSRIDPTTSHRHKTTYSQVGSDTNIAYVSGALGEAGSKKTQVTATAKPADLTKFAKQPVGFFKDRKPLWWAWWLIRAGCLIGVFVGFIVLLTNFYKYRDECSWCKYLSCLDITVGGQNWCEIGYMTFPSSGNSSSTRRSLEFIFDSIGQSQAR